MITVCLRAGILNALCSRLFLVWPAGNGLCSSQLRDTTLPCCISFCDARRIRDAALETGNEPGGVPLTRLSRKVRRSWLLRWSLRGLRSLSEEEVHQRGLPAEAVGDTYDRLLGMLERAVAGASTDLGATYSAHHVADLVSGLDLATARLVVASLDIQGLRTEHAEHVEHGASHG